MSLSELYRLSKGKQKSSQQNAAICLAEPHSPPRSDFAELVWENGQVVMQGQPNRPRKFTSNNIRVEDLPQVTRLRDKGLVKSDNVEMGLRRLGTMETATNDFHIPVPSELDEHDDMVPWLRYHMDEDEHVQHTYSSDFYTEFSGVTAHNLLKDTNNVTPAERCSNGIQAVKDSHPTPVQNPAIFPKVTQLDASSSCPRMKMQTNDLGQQLPTSTIMNFSHFSKHTSLVKSSVDTRSTKVNPEVSVVKKMDSKKIGSIFTGEKPLDPSNVASISGQQRDIGYHNQLAVLSTVDGSKLSISKPIEMPLSANHSGLASCQESKIIQVPTKPVVPNGNTVTRNADKTADPVVASSVCSGNSADRASNDPTYDLKRKYREYEDSEYRSEDIEEESVGIRKAASTRTGSGSKRSRAAEVHNLSERRRRDRINEKMRALQELIPNCNKVDKASMLDEAIEYLKTLQLQLQMMSMGPSLCMPPMMLPQAAHMPRFSPMSVGMGMGMGYGLGMLDMTGNASSYQLVQMPSVPGTRFPMAPAPGLGNLTPAPFPNQQMYGYQGQGLGIPMSYTPATSYATCPPIRPVMDLNSTSSMAPIGNSDLAQPCPMKDTVQNVTLDETPKSNDHFIQGLITNQVCNDINLLRKSKAIESSTNVNRPPVTESM